MNDVQSNTNSTSGLFRYGNVRLSIFDSPSFGVRCTFHRRGYFSFYADIGSSAPAARPILLLLIQGCADRAPKPSVCVCPLVALSRPNRTPYLMSAKDPTRTFDRTRTGPTLRGREIPQFGMAPTRSGKRVRHPPYSSTGSFSATSGGAGCAISQITKTET